jgi:hypothetical protein
VFIARLAFRLADCGSPFDENMRVGLIAPLEAEEEDGVRTAEVVALGAGVTVWNERGLGVEVAGVAVGMS